jgi:hypothetical protein
LQLYSNVVNSMNASPSRIAFVQNEARKGFVQEQQTAMKTDQMTYAGKSGKFTIPQLTEDPASWASRATTARSVGEFYQVPKDDILPFTADEAQQLKKQMDDGGADIKVGIMSKIAAMGDLAPAAAKQLGDKDPVFGYAAGLALSRNDPNTATDIFKGQQAIKDNKTLADTDAMQDSMFKTEMIKYLPAMVGMDPKQANAAIEAAKALYAQRYATSNPQKFDPSAFGTALHTVLGAGKGGQAIDTVNGQKTILPPGVSGTEFDNMLSRLQPTDLLTLSADGRPPRTADGSLVAPNVVANEGKFVAIGGSQYNVKLQDDRWLASGVSTDGARLTKYTMTLDPDTVRKILARPSSGIDRLSNSTAAMPF